MWSLSEWKGDIRRCKKPVTWLKQWIGTPYGTDSAGEDNQVANGALIEFFATSKDDEDLHLVNKRIFAFALRACRPLNSQGDHVLAGVRSRMRRRASYLCPFSSYLVLPDLWIADNGTQVGNGCQIHYAILVMSLSNRPAWYFRPWMTFHFKRQYESWRWRFFPSPSPSPSPAPSHDAIRTVSRIGHVNTWDSGSPLVSNAARHVGILLHRFIGTESRTRCSLTRTRCSLTRTRCSLRIPPSVCTFAWGNCVRWVRHSSQCLIFELEQ